MLRRPLRWLVVILVTSLTAMAEDAISPDDARLLESLIPMPLVDPTGMQWVAVDVQARSVWCQTSRVLRHGWMRQQGEPAQVVFADGETHLLAGDPTPPVVMSFADGCDAVLSPPHEDDHGSSNAFALMRRERATGVGPAPVLALAAWAHRLGDDTHAAQLLALARTPHGDERDGKPRDVIADLRQSLAWHAFADLVHAYMVRADEEALTSGRRLLALYPELAPKQAPTIVAELERRQRDHHDLGDRPWALPEDWATRDADTRISWLIGEIDGVDARQMGQPGGIDFTEDPRVQALLGIGESAVPALIETLDHDRRLCRSVHFWRDFSTDRTVITVREVALSALMTILRTRFFDPSSTGDTFSHRDEATAHALAERIRAYWAEQGSRPIEARFMAVLTDPNADLGRCLEAAQRLAAIDEPITLATTVFADTHHGETLVRRRDAVLAFHDPTAAEAMLASLDRAVATPDVPSWSVDSFLRAIVQLGDRRIVGRIVEHAQAAADPRCRCAWATAADELGEPGLLTQLAQEVRIGSLALPANETDADALLYVLVSALAYTKSPAGHDALAAIAMPSHAYHRRVLEKLLGIRGGPWLDNAWTQDDFCVAVLASALDDLTPTDSEFRVEGQKLIETQPHSTCTSDLTREGPEELRGVPLRQRATERIADAAARALAHLVFGLPAYHPLLPDAEQRLARIRRRMSGFAESLRRLTPAEHDGLQLPEQCRYALIPAPLGHTASAADVDAGRAVFCLPAGGRPTNLGMPALAIWKMPGAAEPVHVLVIQAEDDADGQHHYGIVAPDGLVAVDGDALQAVEPVNPTLPEAIGP